MQVSNLSISIESKDANENIANQSQQRWRSVLNRLTKQESIITEPVERLKDVTAISEVNVTQEGRPPGHSEFRGALGKGSAVLCVPLKSLYKEETPKLILNYSCLSASLHVQRFFGVYRDNTGQYAVMEDLQRELGVFTLKDAFREIGFTSSSSQRRLRLCYEIANTVAYLHSVNLVVKVISECSIFIRFKKNEMLPIFSNLESARSVKSKPENANVY